MVFYLKTPTNLIVILSIGKTPLKPLTNLFFAMLKCLSLTSHWLYQINGFYAPLL